VPAGALAGLGDTIAVLAEHVGPSEALESVKRLLLDQADSLSARAVWLRKLGGAATRLVESLDRQRHPRPTWWANAFERQARSVLGRPGRGWRRGWRRPGAFDRRDPAPRG